MPAIPSRARRRNPRGRAKGVTPLAKFTNVSGTRASAATDGSPGDSQTETWWGPGLPVVKYANDVIRTRRFRGHVWALIEGSRSNYVRHSEELTNVLWTDAGGDPTVVENAVVAPDGTMTADTIDWETTVDMIQMEMDGTEPNTNLWATVYFRADGGDPDIDHSTQTVDQAGTLRRDVFDLNPHPANYTKSVQLEAYPADVGTGAWRLRAISSGSERVLGLVEYWGTDWRFDTNDWTFRDSYITTTTAPAARAADLFFWPKGGGFTHPSLLSGTYKVKILPFWDENHMNNECGILQWSDPAAADVIKEGALDYDGSSGGGLDKFRIADGAGGYNVQSNSLTFDANQTLTVTVDSVAGSIDVQGATAGNGTVTGTPWTVSEEWDLYIGTTKLESDEQLFGWISEPYV